MPLGIKPTVDFAFKKIFGSPQNSAALVGLLNAILDFAEPVVEVRILNPFNYQEFVDSKLIVLDVRCRDAAGRWLNVEMQVWAYGGLVERLVHYACSIYVEQLAAGGNYALSSPSISICLLSRPLFRDSPQAHNRFQMLDKLHPIAASSNSCSLQPDVSRTSTNRPRAKTPIRSHTPSNSGR